MGHIAQFRVLNSSVTLHKLATVARQTHRNPKKLHKGRGVQIKITCLNGVKTESQWGLLLSNFWSFI